MRQFYDAEKSELLWGVICLAGFGVLQFWRPEQYYFSVHLMWTALLAAGLAAMATWTQGWQKNRMFVLWASLVGVGIAADWAWFAAGSPSPQFYTYLWLALIIAGYAGSAFLWRPSKKVLLAGAALNAVVAVAYFAGVPVVQQNIYIIIAATAGLPALHAPFLESI